MSIAGAASAVTLGPGPGSAILSGALSNDSDVALLYLDIAGDTDVVATATTLSYAGSDDGPAGGFDPILTLFDGSGVQLSSDDDSRGVIDPVTGSAYDASLTTTISPGSYVLAVTQYDNFAVGSLAEGFARDGETDFTSAFGCAQGSFCDLGAFDRTGDYVVSVEVAPVPVPAALPLLLGGLAALGFAARRRSAAV